MVNEVRSATEPFSPMEEEPMTRILLFARITGMEPITR